MANSTPAIPSAGPPPKRYLRNYLLDARFQLKFTTYAVGVTVFISILLGWFLWRTTRELLTETQAAVDARSKAAETSKELGNAALSNQLLEHFNDPEFEKQLKEQSRAIDEQYDAEKAAIVAQYQGLKRQQRATVWAVVCALVLFVVFVAAGAIISTHHIVGPLFRFKRMAQEISNGRLRVPTFGLRHGDEFQDFFDILARMTQFLRDSEAQDVKVLQEAMLLAEKSGADSKVIGVLKELEASKKRRLDS